MQLRCLAERFFTWCNAEFANYRIVGGVMDSRSVTWMAVVSIWCCTCTQGQESLAWLEFVNSTGSFQQISVQPISPVTGVASTWTVSPNSSLLFPSQNTGYSISIGGQPPLEIQATNKPTRFRWGRDFLSVELVEGKPILSNAVPSSWVKEFQARIQTQSDWTDDGFANALGVFLTSKQLRSYVISGDDTYVFGLESTRPATKSTLEFIRNCNRIGRQNDASSAFYFPVARERVTNPSGHASLEDMKQIAETTIRESGLPRLVHTVESDEEFYSYSIVERLSKDEDSDVYMAINKYFADRYQIDRLEPLKNVFSDEHAARVQDLLTVLADVFQNEQIDDLQKYEVFSTIRSKVVSMDEDFLNSYFESRGLKPRPTKSRPDALLGTSTPAITIALLAKQSIESQERDGKIQYLTNGQFRINELMEKRGKSFRIPWKDFVNGQRTSFIPGSRWRFKISWADGTEYVKLVEMLSSSTSFTFVKDEFKSPISEKLLNLDEIRNVLPEKFEKENPGTREDP